MVMKNNTAKSLLKQMDNLWKRVEVLLEKDLKLERSFPEIP